MSVTRDLTTLKANYKLGFFVGMDVLDLLFRIYDPKTGKGWTTRRKVPANVY